MKLVKSLGITVAAALTMSISIAQAQDVQKTYVGLGYSNATLDSGGAEATMPMLMVQVGKDLTDNIQIEARYAFSRGDDTQEYDEDGSTYVDTFEISQYWALIGKVHLPVAEGFSIYGLVGLNHMSLKGVGSEKGYSSNTYSNELKETGAALGVGAQYTFNDTISLSAEYQTMVKDVTGLNLGLNYRF